MSDTYATKKSRVGDRRLTANRENAKKSTGPKTDEGKSRSRRNALKHGLAGSGVALPEDVQAEVARRAEQWNGSFKPVNAWEMWLLEYVALQSVRIETCGKLLSARVALLADRADSALWDEDRNALAEELGTQLSRRPGCIVQKMRQSAHGVHWLLCRWEMLRDALRAWGSLNEEQCRLAFDLQGLPAEARATDPVYNGLAGNDDLIALIDREIADLQALIDGGIFDRDEDERLDAADGLVFDDTKEGRQLRRYAKDAENMLKWIVCQFKAGRHLYEGMVRDRSLPAISEFLTKEKEEYDRGPLLELDPADPAIVAEPIEASAANLESAAGAAIADEPSPRAAVSVEKPSEPKPSEPKPKESRNREPAAASTGLMSKLARKIGDATRASWESLATSTPAAPEVDRSAVLTEWDRERALERKARAARLAAELGLNRP